ncbi:hypothetical protein LSH36_196g06025 [Paralvinella palmiformis]|uniref:Uncharacterized protein n=1 Tax=Paralvinella palmiformis TaxID=53620 RepID=A0AAD9JRB3_9ANNE|nr:hypothetical protein LSH36_196g06025 [Paralvinella palmiformis]
MKYSVSSYSTVKALPSKAAQTGGDNLPDIPALDTIPTNQFVGNILAGTDDVEGDIRVTLENKARHISSPTDDTRALSRRTSGSTKSAKLRASAGGNEDDVDTETVLDVKERFPPYDGTGQLAYENACAKFHALPISSFHRKLAEATSIDIKHYGVGPKGAKAIAIPMVINSRVTALNLAGNNLTSEGLEHIVKMMVENDFITRLNLSDNNLKTDGAKLICEMLQLNDNLEVLDISGNGFTSHDSTILCEAIENHIHLKVVNLSNNEFGEESGKAIGSMISETASLRELDLSWNQIRGRAATEIAKGLKENICLKYFDLSWNGFGNKGCMELAEALSSCTLTELNLESNRVGAEGVVALCKALPDTDELKTLKLGKNPLPEEFAVAALELFLSIE